MIRQGEGWRGLLVSDAVLDDVVHGVLHSDDLLRIFVGYLEALVAAELLL